DRSCSAGEPQVEDEAAGTTTPGGEAESEAATAEATEESAAPTTEEPTTEPPATTEASPVPLTVETNDDFARIMTLTDACSPEIADFADRYSGQPIEFDGSIVAMANHGSYETRYDI